MRNGTNRKKLFTFFHVGEEDLDYLRVKSTCKCGKSSVSH